MDRNMAIRWARRLETMLALVLAWGLVFVAPGAWSLRLFGGVVPPAARMGDHAALPRARHVMRRLEAVAARLPRESTCLVKAIAGRMLLARRGIRGAAVRFGVRRNQGGLEAHAWLMLGPAILLGAEEAEGFRPLADL
jgi:hypothetical protein